MKSLFPWEKGTKYVHPSNGCMRKGRVDEKYNLFTQNGIINIKHTL